MERSSISINGVADLPPSVVRGQFPKQEKVTGMQTDIVFVASIFQSVHSYIMY